MKALLVLSLAVLGMIPTISGTAAMRDEAASATIQIESLALLKAQAASSDATLLRPL